VRYLTPEIDALIGLFKRCYERRWTGFAPATWHLVALPGAGALADQDAWTMAALAFARDVSNRLEHDLAKAAEKPKAIERAPDAEEEMVDG
jgi:hypothetical protein